MTSLDLENVLTIGASGMIGSYVDFGLRPGINELDILDKDSVTRYVQKYNPSAIIHLAGATDALRTEQDPLYAYELNVRGTYNVACVARDMGIPMVYASTSRVFKGDKETSYTEEDLPDPQMYYARTKYLGELIITAVVPQYIIARTSWVFGGGLLRDKKFYGNLIKQLNTQEVAALNDVYGSPTYGKDYIATVKSLLASETFGIVHIANEGVATRYDLACHIAKILKPNVVVKPVDRSFFPSASTLPTNESISSKHCVLRPWQKALTEYIVDEWKVQP